VKIRQSRPDEWEKLLGIWRRSMAATHHFISPHHMAEIDRLVAQDYFPKKSFLVAVDRDDSPVAFMHLENGHLRSLFVDAAHRGQGVGRQLVEHALSLTPNLTVEVNEQNDQARAFYERLGFVQTGRTEIDQNGRPYPLLLLKLDSSHTQ
jgi:putative acetyltransferase